MKNMNGWNELLLAVCLQLKIRQTQGKVSKMDNLKYKKCQRTPIYL